MDNCFGSISCLFTAVNWLNLHKMRLHTDNCVFGRESSNHFEITPVQKVFRLLTQVLSDLSSFTDLKDAHCGKPSPTCTNGLDPSFFAATQSVRCSTMLLDELARHKKIGINKFFSRVFTLSWTVFSLFCFFYHSKKIIQPETSLTRKKCFFCVHQTETIFTWIFSVQFSSSCVWQRRDVIYESLVR